MSPIAVTNGADTESRSQRRRWPKIEIAHGGAPTTTEPSTPPRIEIVTNSAAEMTFPLETLGSLIVSATMCAAGPRNRHVARVRYHEPGTFRRRNPPRRRVGSNCPR